MSRSMLLDALRRFLAVEAVALVGAALLGLAIGALWHEQVRRGLAVGFYVGGVVLAALGLLLGTRPPVQATRDADRRGLLTGPVRWASLQERDRAINFPALLLAVAVPLILVGLAVDNRH